MMASRAALGFPGNTEMAVIAAEFMKIAGVSTELTALLPVVVESEGIESEGTPADDPGSIDVPGEDPVDEGKATLAADKGVEARAKERVEKMVRKEERRRIREARKAKREARSRAPKSGAS